VSVRNGHHLPAVATIDRHFALSSLHGDPRRKTALLINPPVYDTQYWAEWSQPYGLVRIAALLAKKRYKHIAFFTARIFNDGGIVDVCLERALPGKTPVCGSIYIAWELPRWVLSHAAPWCAHAPV
jgi:hypothetical protein